MVGRGRGDDTGIVTDQRIKRFLQKGFFNWNEH